MFDLSTNFQYCFPPEDIRKTYFLPSVDCVWGEWSSGACSSSCGKATSKSTRIKIVKEANGGNCEGKSTKTEFCKT